MAERHVPLDELSIGDQSFSRSIDTEGDEATERRDIKDRDLSLTRGQASVIEAGIVALENPDFEKSVEMSLEGLSQVRNAEVFMETAFVAAFIELGDKQSGISLDKLEFPEFRNFGEVMEYVLQPDSYDPNKKLSILLLKGLITFLQRGFSNNVKLEPQNKDDVFRSLYQTFLRRFDYFKQVRKLTKDKNSSPRDLMKRRNTLRKWQEDNVYEIVQPQIPEALKTLPNGLIGALDEDIVWTELNKGCSVNCDFCAFNPQRVVTDSMPFNQAAWLAMAAAGNDNTAYYKGTDPFDYKALGSEHDYADLVTVRECYTGLTPYTSTGFPKGSEARLERIGDRLSRVSVSRSNTKRLLSSGYFNKSGDVYYPVEKDIADALFFGGTRSFNTHYYNLTLPGVIIPPPDMATKVLADSVYNNYGFGLNMALDEHSGVIETGRQRDKMRKKGLGVPKAIEKTTSCMDGVLVGPDRVVNIVTMYTTDQFPSGDCETPLVDYNLINGQQKIEQVYKEVKKGETKNITDILSYGIVQSNYGSRAGGDLSPVAIVAGHGIILKTYDESGNLEGAWRCGYSQVDGTIFAIIKLQ
ncbi:MAG: hypothetical protein ACD_72C00289G0005 [uncultured bacterium]|nr:MAG: hypothetical protein ACD_72C00289G0005 [uncultured bacterium]